MSSYAYTQSRIFQWIGILLALGIIATGYYYFRASAGVKTNVSITDDPLTLGLAGYWKLDDGSGTSATDSSTNGNTGTLTNGPTWTTGQVGGAVDFDGTDDYITVGDRLDVPDNTDFSLAGWFKSDDVVNWHALIAKRSSLDIPGFDVDINNNKINVYLSDTGASTYSLTGTTTLSTATWYHFVFVFDDDSTSLTQIYLNGKSENATKTGTLSNVNDMSSGYSLTFGRLANNVALYNGQMDEIRVYNRSLSESEVSDLYRLTSPTGTDTSLKGYWSFNGKDISGTTAYDRSGAGNNGTLTNGPTVTPGKLGQALDFWPNGSDTNAYVTMGDPASGVLDFGTGDFTLSTWMKGNGYVSQGSTLNSVVGKKNADAAGSAGYRFYYTSSNLMVFNIGDGTTDYSVTAPTNTVSDRAWHYYTGVRSGSTMYFYIDGVSVGSTSVSGSVSNGYNFMAGTSEGNNGRNVNAVVDEVRIYNRALSAAEIQSLYKQGQSDEVNTSASQPQGTGRLDSGLAGYWKLDDGSGTSATDSSTNGNTGTLQSSPSWVTGQIGSALSFSGSNYVSVPHTTSINITGRMTLSAWVNVTAFPANNPSTEPYGRGYILSKGWSTNEAYGLFLYTNAGGTKYLYAGDDAGFVTWAISGWNTGAWHHVLATNDGTSWYLYFDGVQVATAVATPSYTNTRELEIGAMSINGPGNGQRRLNGIIDEARIYGRALSADEISQLYRLTSPTGTDTSLKGYWSFNGKDISGTTAYDRSGAGNNGTLTNGPAVVEGKVGQALDFWPNGSDTNAYVAVGDPSNNSLDFGTGDFSVSFFIKTTGYVSQGSSINRPVFKKGNTNTNGYGFQYDSTNKISLITGDGTSDYTITSPVSIADNVWHFVVGLRSSGVNYLYIDGVSMGSLAFTGSVSSTNPLDIGDDTSGVRNVNGSIDEVRVYNRALSAAEIQSLYKQGQADEVNTSASQPQGTGRLDSGLAGYWKLDDGSGTSATDSSTNGNTGTLTNGPTWTTGQIGGAVDFDGTDDYINLGAIHNFTSSDFTISQWLKFDALTTETVGQGPVIIYKGAYQSTGYYAQVSNTGRLSFVTNQSGAAQSSSTADSSIGTGTWYNFVFARKGSSVRIYINGNDRTETAATHINPTSSGSNLMIGTYTIGNNIEMNGQMDEVRVYNRSLSADEVAQLYRLTSPTGTDTSLKGYWSFNGKDISGTTAYDRSGAGNNGTLTNGPAVVEGKVGQALQFDGSNDYVDAGDSTSFEPSRTITISAWIYPTAAGNYPGIVSKSNSTGEVNCKYSFYLSSTTRKLSFAMGGSVYVSTALTVPLNEWSFVSVTQDNSNLTLTLNGNSETTTTLSSPSYNTETLKIGTWTGGGTQMFFGKIDEVRIYNRALSSSEISALYNQGR